MFHCLIYQHQIPTIFSRMMLSVLIAAAILLRSSLANCPAGWVLYDQNCYKFSVPSGTDSTWTGCQATCSSLGASMLCVENASQNDWIWSQVSPVNTWIAYQDLNNYPHFVWNSGCTSTYTNWVNGQPDNFNREEWYAHFRIDGEGRWNDAGNAAAQRPWWDPYFSCSCQLPLAISEPAVIVGSDSSSGGELVTNTLFWVFFILGLVTFLVLLFLLGRFYRKHWCPNKTYRKHWSPVKTVDYLAAFEMLQREDNKITENGHGEVVSLLSDYGVRAGEDFEELEDTDITLIASKLRKVPRNRFLKYLGRKWSGDDPVVVADDTITACDVEMSTVNMHKSV